MKSKGVITSGLLKCREVNLSGTEQEVLFIKCKDQDLVRKNDRNWPKRKTKCTPSEGAGVLESVFIPVSECAAGGQYPAKVTQESIEYL